MKLGARCSDCPLNGQVPVLSEGPLGAKLACIGEAPGRDEVKANRPFIGRSGEELDKYLLQVGTARPAVVLGNAVACFPPGGDWKTFLTLAKKKWKEEHGTGKKAKPFQNPIDCCRPRLFEELRVDKCKLCGKYLGLRHIPLVTCSCSKPLRVSRNGSTIVVPMGNAAMESLLGFDGITKWRGSCLKAER